MIDQPAYIKVLLQKYLEGTATKAEVAQLMAAWDVYDDEELSDMIADITGDYKNTETEEEQTDAPHEEMAEYKKETSPPVNKSLSKDVLFDRIFFITALSILAAVLIWVFTRQEQKPIQNLCNGVPVNTELPTGPYSCRLTLANGNSVLIDSTHKGFITQEAAVEIIQPEPGLLVYKRSGLAVKESAITIYHTIETAPGQQYKIILPDGSNVRLNAASSIRFPVTFSKNERRVHLIGEAFFEVLPDSTAPFYVYTGNAELKVQGATFNVNAYVQKTVATLLTGQLQIKAGSATAMLTDDKHAMAVVNAQSLKQKIILTEGDTLSAVSWTKTTRMYKNVSMRDFVVEMGRWYNLEVRNLSCIPATARISIVMCYNTPIEQLLTIFGETKLKFYKVGNRITFCDPALRPVSPPKIPLK